MYFILKKHGFHNLGAISNFTKYFYVKQYLGVCEWIPDSWRFKLIYGKRNFNQLTQVKLNVFAFKSRPQVVNIK